MTRSHMRAYRLATAVAITGVSALAASPALASNGISYYNGSGTGQAVNVTVAPSAILNANLAELQATLAKLDAKLPVGAAGTVNNIAGSTLQNPTADINVLIDAAHSEGVSQSGVNLSDGSAYSTPVSVNAASLASEVGLLNSLLQNMPNGTVAALDKAVAPIENGSVAGGALKTALAQVESDLSITAPGGQLYLGSPSAHILQSVNAKFGEDKNGDIVTINQGGALTQAAAYHLDPFEARAVATDAYANNAVTSLNIAPGVLGKLSVPGMDIARLTADLSNLQAVLTQAETKLGATISSTAPGLVGNLAGGVLNSASNLTNPTVKNVINVTTSTGTTAVDLNQVNALINSTVALRNAMSALNGLTMNDIVNTGPSTALGTLKRDGDQVKATGFSQVAHVEAVKINNPALVGLLNTVVTKLPGGQAFNGTLVTVDGIKANAAVTLDGKTNSPTMKTAEGHLANVYVLGQKVISGDDYLKPGTSCTVKIPGGTNCGGSLSNLNGLGDATNGVIDSLLTVTLTRGTYVPSALDSATYGEAKIVTLEVAVDLNLAQLNKLAATNSTAAQLLGLVTGHADVPGVGSVSLGNGGRLIDTPGGVAAASVSLNPAFNSRTPGQPPVAPPNTGNNVLPLAILALALAGGAIGIGARKGGFLRG